MYIREYMHTKVITATKNMQLSEAQELMAKHNIRRLPVVEKKDKLLGLVTQDRIRETMKHPGLNIEPFEFLATVAKLKVKDVMVTDVVTVTPDTTVEEAVGIGQKHRVGTLPVVENGKLVGIVTTTDLYRLASEILGFGKPGVRLHVYGTKARPIGEVTSIIASKGVEILSLVRVTPPATGRYDSVIHLDTEDASSIIAELMARGYGVDQRVSVASRGSSVTASQAP